MHKIFLFLYIFTIIQQYEADILCSEDQHALFRDPAGQQLLAFKNSTNVRTNFILNKYLILSHAEMVKQIWF